EARLFEVERFDAGAAGLDWSLLADARNPASIMTALSAQGKATVLAAPRLFALNNEPAILKTGALTLSVTPQIATNAVVMLSLSSVLPSPADAEAEADTLARVAGGETVVVSGFSFGRDTKRGWFGRSAG